jgi:hypothetical protein
MVGTTRSRVNFFMNKFRKLGLIEYNAASRSTALCSASSSTSETRREMRAPAKLAARVLDAFAQGLRRFIPQEQNG